MIKTLLKRNSISSLRKKAETKLKNQDRRIKKLSTQSISDLAHELGTHQIELEMQNEELRRTQEELEDSRSRYVELYDFAPIGYFTFDAHGLMLEMNLTGAGLLGVERRSALNKPFTVFLAGPAERNLFSRHCREVVRGQGKQECEVRLRKKDGTSFFAQIQSVAVEGGGKVGPIRSMIFDITERKKAEAALDIAHAELIRRTQELAASNKELETFSYAVSHDLRSPLWYIAGFIDVLEENYSEELDEKGRDHLRRVSDGAQRMKQLIEALLNLSRYMNAPLNRVKVDLSEMVKTSLAEHAQVWPERKVELIIAEGVTAEGDPSILDVAIRNLIGNAWKFSEKRPDAKIEFGETELEGKTVYYVRDNGAGFDKEFGDKLFTPFQRLHSEDEFPGLGIGLTTVQRIIHRHGGRIWAESEVNKGATFYFTLN